MTQRIIDIGVQGNDGTGDSIRESFNKVNQNFAELYAIFGVGGTIKFTDLSDAPSSYRASQIIMSSKTGVGLTARDLEAGAGILISKNDDTKLTISASIAGLVNDNKPTLAASMDASGKSIGNLGDLPTSSQLDEYNRLYGTNLTDDSTFAITKGYADNNYVGGTAVKASNNSIIGYQLDKPLKIRPEPLLPDSTDVDYDPTLSGNYVATEAIPRKDAVYRGGDTMTGALTLGDHPSPFQGYGTPLTGDDLQAATKFYVDANTYYSGVNLYVSTTKGDDLQTNTPVGREGRAWHYAYKTISAAAQQAETLIKLSQTEPGPYKQAITWSTSVSQYPSVVQSYQPVGGNSATTGYQNAIWLLQQNKAFIQSETIAYLNKKYVNTFNLDKVRYTALLNSLLSSVGYDLVLGTNYNSVAEVQKIFNSYNNDLTSDQLTQLIDGINYAKTQIINYGFVSASLDAYLDSLIKALAYDVVFQSNYQSIQAALSFASSNSTIEASELADLLDYSTIQINQVVGDGSTVTLTFDKQITAPFVLNEPIVVSGMSPSGYNGIYTVTGVTDTTVSYANSTATAIITKGVVSKSNLINNILLIPAIASTPAVITNLKLCADTISVIVQGGEIPQPTFTPLTSSIPGQTSAVTLLLNNIPFIQSEIAGWLRVHYPALSYDRAKSNRDIEYIVWSLCYDLLYGGNSQSAYAGLKYWNPDTSTSYLTDAEKVACSAAVSYINTVAQAVITNTPPATLYQQSVSQYINSTLSGNNTATGTFVSTSNYTLTVQTGNVPISQGQVITGTGFTGGQTVVAVTVSGSNSIVTLSALPNTTPAGTLTFTSPVLGSISSNVITINSIMSSVSLPVPSVVSPTTSGSSYQAARNAMITPTELVALKGAADTYLQNSKFAIISNSAVVNSINTLFNTVTDLLTVGASKMYAVGLVTAGSSSSTTMTVTSVSGIISPGQRVYGIGFSTQTVQSVTVSGNSVTITLSNTPGSNPTSYVKFIYAPTIPTNAISSSSAAAVNALLANADFIANEAAEYVAQLPDFAGVTFSKTGLIRDVIYAVEAVCYDVANGTNVAAVNVANNQFWHNGNSLVPGLYAVNQLYNRAFIYAQTLAGEVSRNDSPLTTYSTVQQSKNSAWAVGGGAGTAISTLFTTIIDILTNNNADTYIPTYPDLSNLSNTDYLSARTIINNNKSTISNSVNSYLASTYTGNFKYNQATCYRDLGYIFDGAVIDLYTGGTYQSVNAGTAYYRNSSAKSVAIGTQYTETVDGIQFARDLAIQVLNQQSSQRFQSYMTQVTSGSHNVTTDAITAFTNNYNIILNIIKYGFGAAPTPSFGSGTYSVTMSNGGNGYVDQGATGNTHIIPGKVVVGNISNAYAQIVSYTPGGNGISVDSLVLRMTRPGFFICFTTTATSGFANAYTVTVDSATNIVVGLGVTGVGIGLGAVVTAVNGIDITLSVPNYSTVSGTLTFGEPLSFGETVPSLPITIFVESGIYYEDYPIRLADNVSVKGDDFRRVLIRPLDRVSQSPWASIFSYRDGIIDAMQLNPISYTTDYAASTTLTLSGKSGTFNATLSSGLAPQSWIGKVLTDNTSDGTVIGKAVVNNVTGNVVNCTTIVPFVSTTFTSGNWHIYGTTNYGRHYLTNPLDITSTPKNNKEIDAFLMNDSTHITAVSFQGHGGFAVVLDPTGQVKTKSPFLRDCASFTSSTNKKRFAGGIFVDGFAGRLSGTIQAVQTTGANNQSQIKVVGWQNSGLDVRAPQIPCSFFIQGQRYQIDDVASYDSSTYTAWLTLDITTPFSTQSSYNNTVMNTNMGNIIDALSYDLALGSNYRTTRMGLSYLLPQNAVSGLGQTLVTQAVSYIKTQANSIGLDSAGTTSVNTNTTNINNIINNGTGSVPALLLPAATSSTVDSVSVKNILQDSSNRSFIQQEITAWIAANYNLSSINGYSSITTQQDFGYMIDAICYDILYGGNSATYDLASTFWYNNSTQSTLTAAGNYTYGTITIYTQALARLATVVQQAIVNTTIAKSAGNNITQNTGLTPATTTSLVSVSVTGTAGQFSCNNTTLVVGQYVTISGTNSGSGSISGYSNPSTYYIIATNGSSTFTLSSTYGGSAITTTAGTTTGLTFTTSASARTVATLVGQLVDYIADGTYNNTTVRLDPDAIVAGQASNLTTDFALLKTTNKTTILTNLSAYLVNGAGIQINIEMAGNRSILGDNFTQVNDLGYGVVATNGGVSEQVSTFTYYCYTSMWAINGGQIRSVGSSSAHGNYGLRASSYNPTELPDSIVMVNDMVQTARVYKQGITAGYMTPFPTTQAFNVYIVGYKYIPTNNSELEIDHTLAGGSVTRYSISQVQRTTITINGQNVLNLTLSTSGLGGTTSTGLAYPLYDGQTVSIKVLEDIQFSGVASSSLGSSTTSLQYVPTLADIYSVTSYSLTYSTGDTLPATNAIIENNAVFNYYQLATDNTKLTVVDPDDASKTQGSKTSDNKIAIIPAGNDLIISQINTGTLLTSWAGRVHRISKYTREKYSGGGTVFTQTPTLLSTSSTGNLLTLSSNSGLIVNSPIVFTAVTQTPTLLSTTPSGNLLTLSSTTGIVVGEPIVFTAATQPGYATQTYASNNGSRPNQIVIGPSTTGMVVGEPITFFGVGFGGLSAGTYYIASVPDSTHITVSATYGGATVALTAATGSMSVNAGASLGGIVDGTTYYVKSIVGNSITVSLTYGGSAVSVTQEAGSWTSIAGGSLGGISSGITYYINSLVSTNQITIGTTVGGANLSLTNATGTWTSIAGASAGGLTLVISGASGTIVDGQPIVGTGFSSNQTVSGAPVTSGSYTLVTLSAIPNSLPSGSLTFGTASNAFITIDPNPVFNSAASGSGVNAFTYVSSVNGPTLKSTGNPVTLATFNVPYAYMVSGSASTALPVPDSFTTISGSTNSSYDGTYQVYNVNNQSTINVASTSGLVTGMSLFAGYLGTITATANNTVSFTATISGTTLTVTGGTTPSIGMIISGTGISAGTYIVSGTGPFTLNQAATNGSGISVSGVSNYLTVSSATGLSAGKQIVVTLTYNNGASTGASFGSVVTGTYYVLTVSGTSITVGLTSTGAPITVVTATGNLGFQVAYTDSNTILPGSCIVQSITDSNNFIVSPAAWLPVGTPLIATMPTTVSSVTISNGGSGYNQSSPPIVTFTGGGSDSSVVQAIANATVNQYGVVTKITVTSPGQGYTSSPTITIAPPASGTQAQASVVMSSAVSYTSSVVQSTPTTQVTIAYPSAPGLSTTATATTNSTASVTTSTITAGSAITLTNGAINGTTLTFTSASGGTVAAGMVITGGTVQAGTYIVSGSGTSWVVNVGQVASCTTATLYTFNSGAPTGTFLVGMVLSGGAISGSPYITRQLTATNSAAATTTATASSGASIITVASATGIAVGQFVVATGISNNTYVTGVNGTAISISQVTTSALSGTAINFYTAGQAGTYAISKNVTQTSTTITGTANLITVGSISNEVVNGPITFSGTGFGNVTSSVAATGTFNSGNPASNVLVVSSVSGTISVGQVISGSGFNGTQVVVSVSVVGSTATVLMNTGPTSTPSGTISFSSFTYYVTAAVQGAAGNYISVSTTSGGSNLVVTSATGSLTAYSPDFVINPSTTVSGSPTKSGSSTPYSVTFTVSSAISITNGAYYTVTGNTNSLYNGTWATSSSTSTSATTLILTYPYDPGTWSTATTTSIAASSSNSSTSSQLGVGRPFDSFQQNSLEVGFAAGTLAQITTKISTTRATSHDFLNIGTGGYNTTNYPSVIYGDPVLKPDYTKQTLEESVGRVFFVSTDQDGIFRVGKFFNINQNTGNVALGQSISLNNLNGLGFKNGITVTSFSNDATFSNPSSNTIPTQLAISNYVDYRLGLTAGGSQVSNTSLLGPGFMPLNGAQAMTGNLNMNGSNIINLVMPLISSSTDVANKGYVDQEVGKRDSYAKLRDISFSSLADGNVAIYDYASSTWKNIAQPTGDVNITYAAGSPGTLTTAIQSNKIYNSMVNTVANVAQSKLWMNWAAQTSAASTTTITVNTNTTLSGVAIVSTTGGFACNTTTLYVGQSVVISGTFGGSGSITGYSNPTTYYIIATNGTTTFTLSSTYNGSAIATSTGTPTGLTYTVAPLVVGKTYTIAALGTTTNTQWNTIAGTSNVTYVVGSTFQSAVTLGSGTGTVYDNTTIQATLGLASFDNTIFTVTNGYVSLKTSTGTSDGIPISKFQQMTSGYLLGRRTAGTGAVENNITPANVVSDGGGMFTSSFGTTTGALTQSVASYTFVATFSGTNMTVTSGTTPTAGSAISGSGIPAGTTIVSGAGASWVVSNSVSGTGITVTGIAAGTPTVYSVTPISVSNAASSLVKSNTDNSVDVGSLKVAGTPTITSTGTTIQFANNGAGASVYFLTSSQSGTAASTITTQTYGIFDTTAGTLRANTLYASTLATDVTSYVGIFRPSASSQIDLATNGATLLSKTLSTGAAGTAGVITGQWTLSGSSTLQATYADLAEYYEGDKEYEPGTVLVFGGEKEVTTTDQLADTRVAGVVTTNPAYIMNHEQTGIKVCIALAGRVPIKVVGRVRKGDMLTTAATPGYAVKALDPKLGSIIGKALEDKDYGEAGVIQIAVGRM